MGGPVSVTFSNIYMVKIENNTKIPSKSILYWRYADVVHSRQKLGGNVLFER